MAQAPAVIVKRPTVIQQFNITQPATFPQVDQYSITVPYTMWERVDLFIPPGANYSVRVAFGYNDKRLIPNEDDSTYIVGAGFLHSYPVGIPVYNTVDLWVWHNNAFPHLISVELFLNYAPIEDAARRQAMVTPQ